MGGLFLSLAGGAVSMITNLYIDGFSLYYRAVVETSYKWLNLRLLGENLFPNDIVQSIHYFTARLIARPGKPQDLEAKRQRRQLVYIRALETISSLSVHYGRFQLIRDERALAEHPYEIKLRRSAPQEKKTDVNLAARLIVDGCKGAYQQAALISKDSDFVGAMLAVRNELGLPIVLVNPDWRQAPRDDEDRTEDTTKELSDAATRAMQIEEKHLAASQFPNEVRDAKGIVRKPVEWR